MLRKETKIENVVSRNISNSVYPFGYTYISYLTNKVIV